MGIEQEDSTNCTVTTDMKLSTAPVAVLGFNHSGEILLANQLAAKLLYCKQHNLIGASIGEFFPKTLCDSNQRFHQTSLQLSQAQQTENGLNLLLKRADGSVIPVSVGVNFLRQGGDEMNFITMQNLSLQYQTEEAVLAERNRIARQLHDSVTQTLFSASMIADVLPQLWQLSKDEGAIRLKELQHLTRSAMAEMETLLHELHPIMLIDVELDELLHQLVKMTQNKNDVSIHFDRRGDIELPFSVRLGFYRIAQEALSNVSHHANATYIDLVLEHDDGYTVLKIADNGRGFDVAGLGGESKQPGLNSMRERAKEFGANLKIESQIGVGTAILVRWPYLDVATTFEENGA